MTRDRKTLYRAPHDRCKMRRVLDLAGAQSRNRHRRSHINHFSSNSLLFEELLLFRNKEGQETEVSSGQADSNSGRLRDLRLCL